MKRYAVLLLLLCSLVGSLQAQVSIEYDSAQFNWITPLDMDSPSAYELDGYMLSDGNFMAQWYTGGGGYPLYDEPYGSVVSPEGEVLIPDQILLSGPGNLGHSVACEDGGFMLVEYENNPAPPHGTVVKAYRFMPNYEAGTFDELWSMVVEESIDSVYISPSEKKLHVNGDRLFIGSDSSDRNLGSDEYAPAFVQMIDLTLRQCLIDDPYSQSAYISYSSIEVFEDGFLVRNQGRHHCFHLDGSNAWTYYPDEVLFWSAMTTDEDFVYSVGTHSGADLVLYKNDLETGELAGLYTLMTDLPTPFGADIKFDGDDLLIVSEPLWIPEYQMPNYLMALNTSGEFLGPLHPLTIVGGRSAFIGPNFLYRAAYYQMGNFFDYADGYFEVDEAFALHYWNSLHHFPTVAYDGSSYIGVSRRNTIYNNVAAYSFDRNSVPVDEGFDLPLQFSFDIAPNPFNMSTQLSITIPTPTNLGVDVFNILGQVILQVPPRDFSAGRHSLSLDLEGQASGIYTVQVYTPHHAETRRMTLIK